MAFTKNFLVILLNFLVLVATQDVQLPSPENVIFETSDSLDPYKESLENVPQDFLLSWQARRSLRRILAQMPCGWPEYNIPPLAPFIDENLTLGLQTSYAESYNNFSPLRIDGLENMEINRLTVGVIFKRIQFDFNFPNITLSGNFSTSNLVDMEKLLGLTVAVKGSGMQHLSLENLRIVGSLKYKLPIFLSSAKILKAQLHISLENAQSELTGSINGIQIGSEHNDLISSMILKSFNDSDFFWNALLEDRVLPFLNEQLEGKNLWKLLLWSMQRDAINCSEQMDDFDKIEVQELHKLLLREQRLVE